MAILQSAHVTAQLFLNTFGGTVKGNMRILRFAAAFKYQALHHMHDNIAGKPVMWRTAKGCMR
jgi:hypothetical protein